MTPQQKRVITIICQGNIGYENIAAIMLDVHRGAKSWNRGRGQLAGVPRQEIIDYAHERSGLNKAQLNTEMEEG